MATMKSRKGNLNPSWNEDLHNIPCKCGCGNFLKSYYERQNGFIAYHNKERVSVSRSKNAKKAIISTQKKLNERYGVINPAKVVGAMDKRRNTWMLKYGVKNVGALNKTKSTDIETKIELLLLDNNFIYEKEYNVLGWLVDFVILDKKLIIECDGDYWHSKQDVKKLDEIKNKEFKLNGWKLVRLKGSEIKSNINECLIKINSVI